MQLIQCSLLLSALYLSSGAYKTVCAALGIVMFPAVYRWCGWVGTIPVPIHPHQR